MSVDFQRAARTASNNGVRDSEMDQDYITERDKRKTGRGWKSETGKETDHRDGNIGRPAQIGRNGTNRADNARQSPR